MRKPSLTILTIASVLTTAPVLLPASAAAQSQILGTIDYSGDLGPVSNLRPLCLCIYGDPDLQQGLGCLILSSNGAPYRYPTFDTNPYYLIAFLDIDRDERHDGNEPFEIYNDRGVVPADAVRPAPDLTGVDFAFGDENLAPQPTPTPGPCTGDCDRSGRVTIDEVLTLVDISLKDLDVSVCEQGDPNENDQLEINEIVAAVRNAARRCLPHP